MRRTICTASLCLAAALSLRAQQPTFRTAVDLVHFGVAVVDKQGKPVTGLTAEDFQVLENGKPQTLKYFSAGAPEEAPPLHLGLLLDTSGSMAGDIKDARSAAVKFVNALDHAADVTLVDFDTEVRVARFGPNDYPRLVERIRGRKPDGWTALYDAIGVYLNGAQTQDGQKVLVLYTDGGDTRSSLSFYDMLNLCKASDVTVYAVGYMEHQGGSRLQQRNELERVASTTAQRSGSAAAIAVNPRSTRAWKSSPACSKRSSWRLRIRSAVTSAGIVRSTTRSGQISPIAHSLIRRTSSSARPRP